MNCLSQIILLFCALIAQTISYGMDYTLDPYEINGIITWTGPNCQGIAASTIFNGSTLSKNISNACLSRSFKLLRPLQGQEQLDISITQEPDIWYPYEGQSSMNSLSCTSFIQSYFPVNGSEGCYNTPPFTCHRLWVNYGLNSVLKGPNPSESWALPSPLPTIIPSVCFRPRSTPTSGSSSSSFSPSIYASSTSAGTSAIPPGISSSASLSRNLLWSLRNSMTHPSSSGRFTPSPTSMHISLPISSSSPIPTSSRSFTRMVQVIPGEVTEFVPQTLNALVGETVWFYSLNGSFLLYNTTLEEPCSRLTRFGDDAHQHVLYQVNSSEPMWFVGYKRLDSYHCDPPTHFALNPGNLTESFFQVISLKYTIATIVVNPAGDVITTLIS